MTREETLKFIENSLKIIDQPDIAKQFEEFKSKVQSGNDLTSEEWFRMSSLLSLQSDVSAADSRVYQELADAQLEYINDIKDILEQANTDLNLANAKMTEE